MNVIRSRGFTLVETLLTIGIIGVLAIAAFVIYPRVQLSNRVNTEQTNIVAIAVGIREMFGVKRDFTGINNTAVNVARITPVTMNGGNFDSAIITSPVGGNVTIGSMPAPDQDTFFIYYQEIPSAECSRIVQNVAGQFDFIHVGLGNAVQTVLTSTSPPAAILDACNRNGDTPSAVWFYTD